MGKMKWLGMIGYWPMLLSCNVLSYDACQAPSIDLPLDFSEFHRFDFYRSQAIPSIDLLPTDRVIEAHLMQAGDAIQASMIVLVRGNGDVGCGPGPTESEPPCVLNLPERRLTNLEAARVRRAFSQVYARLRFDDTLLVAQSFVRGLSGLWPTFLYQEQATWDAFAVAVNVYDVSYTVSGTCAQFFILDSALAVLEELRAGWE